MVAGDLGQEEGQAQTRGCLHYPQVPADGTICTKYANTEKTSVCQHRFLKCQGHGVLYYSRHLISSCPPPNMLFLDPFIQVISKTASATCFVDYVNPFNTSPHLIRRFIKGFIYRHKERCPENEYFLDYVRYSFLMNLHRNLPKNVLDKSWPTPPAALTEVYSNTKHLCIQRNIYTTQTQIYTG